ncbi:MAG: FAD-dependent oxidoreductase, partial [Eubacteriales bacterium]|nr:FAD-dependent oxidoreductase [Eubacteriales bacterium]
RKGAKTLIIEATGCLGGMSTMGLVPTWCPFSDKEQVIYKGIAQEIFNASNAGVDHVKPGDVDWVAIEPEHLKLVYDKLVTEAGADILFNTMLSAVEAEDGEVKTIIVSNKAGLSAYKAKVYIDCTGDADLAAWAGAEVIPVDEGSGYQPATHCFEVSNVNIYSYRSGPWLHPNNNQSPIHEIVASGKYDIPDGHLCNNEVAPGTVGFNAGHIWNVDNTDPHSVSDALIKGRKLAHEIHRALVDYQPKTFAGSKVSLTAPLMGIRETRRILGDYILVTDDYLDRKTFDDEICRNSYYIDVHHSAEEAKLINSGKLDLETRARRYNPGESHGVPYRCLTPKGLKNVIVAGRSISTDRALQGSTRVMPVCLCMGEAAGKAAAIAMNSQNIDMHNIDVQLLRKQIIEDGGYIK